MTDSETPPTSGYGPSPLDPAPRTLAQPVSRGFALGLVALVLVVLGWMWAQQQQRLDELAGQVDPVTFTSGSTGGIGTADPELCWLLGVIADAQGKGDVVAGMGAGSDSMTECQSYAMRGARGQGPSGN
jgi:hypothetical protein